MIEVSTTSTNIAAASRIWSLRSVRIGPAAPSDASTVVITYLVPVPARVRGSEATMVGHAGLGTTRNGSGAGVVSGVRGGSAQVSGRTRQSTVPAPTGSGAGAGADSGSSAHAAALASS